MEASINHADRPNKLATFYLLSAGSSFIWVAKKQVSSRQLRAKLLVRCNVMAGSKFA